MNLAQILAAGVAEIDRQTKSAQPQVQWFAWTGDDPYGSSTYTDRGFIEAIVDLTSEDRTSPSGQVLRTGARIVIPRPLDPVGGLPERNEPIDMRDVFILPDGTSGPIVEINGFVNKETNSPYFADIWLGARTTVTR